MVSYGQLRRCFFALMLTAMVLTAVVDAEKIFTCCTTVSRKEIQTPITAFWLQKWNPPCVKAVIFETEGQHICSHWSEPWVQKKVVELLFQKSKAPEILPPTTPLGLSSGSPAPAPATSNHPPPLPSGRQR